MIYEIMFRCENGQVNFVQIEADSLNDARLKFDDQLINRIENNQIIWVKETEWLKLLMENNTF